MPNSPGRNEVAQHIDLNQIRYSMVWEDHDLLVSGLKITPDDHVLAIVSGGNNVLSILLREPAKITAVDMSPAQIALFDLKLAGIRHLSHDAFLTLLGFGGDPLPVFESITPELSPDTATFWKDNTATIQNGIYRCGRLERYFGLFQTEHLSQCWAPDLVERLFAAPDLTTQVGLFEDEALTPDFKRRFLAYFGQESMAKSGRTTAQFKYVKHDDIAEYFLERFHHVCTSRLLRGNFYVERFLTGTHRDLEQGPEYLRRESFQKLKGLIDRITVVRAELEEVLSGAAPNTFTKSMLSDVFEYMSEDDANRLFAQLARGVAPGGRIAYWNLLVPRGRPEHLSERLRPLTEESQPLWQRDSAWFYRNFLLDEVLT